MEGSNASTFFIFQKGGSPRFSDALLNDVIPQLQLQRHMGSEGGLFTRSGSVADPWSAERPSAMANPNNR